MEETTTVASSPSPGDSTIDNTVISPGTTTAAAASCTTEFSQEFIVGLALAVSSSIFIGSSFILKKKGLLRVARNSSHRAGKGGYAYLKEWLWWVGLITMAVGEAANFAAYGFAPAVLVTPLGALSVLVSAVLSSTLLQENLNVHGKVGCVLSILGSTIIIIHAPEDGYIEDLWKIGKNMMSIGFIAYSLLAVGIAVYLIVWVAPLKGQSNILVYLAICSLIGSLSVVGCKGLSIAIKLTLSGNSQFYNPLAWFFLISVATCITIQMNYLNKSLDIFNTSLVTPIYYVMFTTFTIMASTILFKEWSNVTSSDIVGSICGFSVIICGVFLLHAFKDIKLTFRDLLISNSQSNGESFAQEPVLIMEDIHRSSPAGSPISRSRTDLHSGSEEEILVSENSQFLKSNNA